MGLTGTKHQRSGEDDVMKNFMISTARQYYSSDQNKKNEKGRHVTRMEDRRGAHRDLVERLEGKIPLGKPRRRWLE